MRPIATLFRAVSPAETLGAFASQATTTDALVRDGVRPAVAATLAARIVRCTNALLDAGTPASTRASALVVPGRIEILGKHTDYGGGRSLLVATEQAIVLVCAERLDRRLEIYDLGLGREATLDVAPALEARPGDWTNYPRVVARWLATCFPGQISGATVAFESALPKAAGLSSSSALVTATFLALCSVSACARADAFATAVHDAATLADCLGAIEAGRPFAAFAEGDGVGTRGGSQDHTAIVGSAEGHVVQYAFGPARFERRLPLPPGHVFVVATSGIDASKASTERDAYNALSERLRAIERVCRMLAPDRDGSLGRALESEPGLERALRQALARQPEERRGMLLARFDQFVAETFEIVPGAADALAAHDLDRFGAIVDRSQALAEAGLGNQIAETSALQRLARQSGAVAASAFGAGFGGSVWALVREGDAEGFERVWREAYTRHYPARRLAATFFRTRASRPAMRLTLD